MYYFCSPDHKGYHVLSFAFCFDLEEDAYQFSLTYPYSYSRMQAYLAQLENKKLPYCRRNNLANTIVSHFLSSQNVIFSRHCFSIELYKSLIFFNQKNDGNFRYHARIFRFSYKFRQIFSYA